jgi:hypothetical protein
MLLTAPDLSISLGQSLKVEFTLLIVFVIVVAVPQIISFRHLSFNSLSR